MTRFAAVSVTEPEAAAAATAAYLRSDKPGKTGGRRKKIGDTHAIDPIRRRVTAMLHLMATAPEA